MRSFLFILPIAHALAGAGAAHAAQVAFVFSSVVGGNGANMMGVQAGQPIEIVVLADNGGAGFSDTSWTSAHHISTTVRIGSLSLTQAGAIEFSARTNGTGSVVAFDLFTTNPDGINGSGIALSLNGARNFMIRGEETVDAERLTVPANWDARPR